MWISVLCVRDRETESEIWIYDKVSSEGLQVAFVWSRKKERLSCKYVEIRDRYLKS